MARRTGLAAETLASLRGVAKAGGGDLETLEHGLEHMQRKLVEAASGSCEAQDAFTRLGLSVEALGRLTDEQRLLAIADAMAGLRSQAERTAAAVQIFGRHGGVALAPGLAQGAAGVRAS